MSLLKFLAVAATIATVTVALPYRAMPPMHPMYQTHYSMHLPSTSSHVFQPNAAGAISSDPAEAVSMPTFHTVVEANGDPGDDDEIGALFTTSLPPYQHAASTVPSGTWHLVKHSDIDTEYITWAFGVERERNGLTWGIQCKGKGCQARTPFVGKPKNSMYGPLVRKITHITGWTDESHQNGKVFCPKYSFVKSMICKDSACTALKLLCSPVRMRFNPVYGKHWRGVWEEPGYQRVFCREGMYVDGVECIGSCTTKFNILCSTVIEFK